MSISRSQRRVLSATLSTVFTGMMISSSVTANEASKECLLREIEQAGNELKVGELRSACQKSDHEDSRDSAAIERVPVYEQGAIRERIDLESNAENSSFVITPHFPNFIQYSTFDPNQAPFETLTGIPDSVENNEAIFQVSFKVPVWRNMFDTNLSTYFAYTSRSWWQVANNNYSSPFRETNYMPEVFVRSVQPRRIFGISIEGWSLGLVHESNGREQALSRSWNRVMGRFGVQVTDDLSLLGQVWYRIPEDKEDDDNPNMYHYYGYGDLRAVWTPDKHTFTVFIRPGTEETSYELTWSYPISQVFRVYASYYNGYGESLLDYDFETERFSLGHCPQ